MKLRLSVVFLFVLSISLSAQKVVKLYSPDKTLELTLEEKKGEVYYSLKKDQKPVLSNSKLGFELKEGQLSKNFKIAQTKTSSKDETWSQVWGEEIDVRNHYNELFAELKQKKGEKYSLNLRFRVFNDGIGFRYEFPKQSGLTKFTILDEYTEFNFPNDAKTWSLSHNAEFYEGLYREMPLSKLDTVKTPLTIETKAGLFLAAHEANLTEFASLNLYPKTENSTHLKAYLTPWSNGDKVYAKTPSVSPWRTLIVAKSAGDLMLSRLMLNLNEPSQIEDTSWIKPGRYIGIWWGMHMKTNTWDMGPTHGAETSNVLRYIDFAARHNFAGVLVEGWNKGWEDWKSFEFSTPYPDFDIKKITEYGKAKGVKLIGHHETGGSTINYEKQMDAAFDFYNKYGVDVVKTGYVGGVLDGKENHGSQYGVRHYRKVIENAAKHKIMIDNHEPVMPTGLQRTFPNLMTQEGVRGQEWDAWSKDGGNPPNHTTIIPFTRGLAGPMDFTPGTFNFENPVIPGTRVWTTLAKQLALSVIIYSPLQMASDEIENYENKLEFEFLTKVPTTFSKTVVPSAEIGEFVTIARRDVNGKDWYVGSITNEKPRDIKIPLDFLEKGVSYKAKIFRDGPGADYKTNPYPVVIEEKIVFDKDVLEFHLAPGGGLGLLLEKQ